MVSVLEFLGPKSRSVNLIIQRGLSVKVKELVKRLQQLDQETEIRISLRKGWRPHSTKTIQTIDHVINQNTNRLGFYAIDVDIKLPKGFEILKENILVQENDKNNR